MEKKSLIFSISFVLLIILIQVLTVEETSGATSCGAYGCFIIRNASGNIMHIIDGAGNMDVARNFSENGDFSTWSGLGSFLVKNANGSTVAAMSKLGNVAILGSLSQNNGGSCAPETQISYTTAGTTGWVAPAGVTSVTVEVWGGGGGAGSCPDPNAAGGGGGGAYSKKSNIAVTPGTNYTVVVGAKGSKGSCGPGDGSAGGDSYFINTSFLLAKGGSGGKGTNPWTGGAGGDAASGVGDVKYSGGKGGNGEITGTNEGGGGGGGSSAGTGSNGNNGTAGSGNLGGAGGSAPTGGGAGANGRDWCAGNAASATQVGGGGGGVGAYCGANFNGGDGYAGKVTISYNTKSFIIINQTGTCIAYINDSGGMWLRGSLLTYGVSTNLICCTAGEGGSASCDCGAHKSVIALKYAKYGASDCGNLGACNSSSGADCANKPSCVGSQICNLSCDNTQCGDTCGDYAKTCWMTVACSPT